MIRVTSIEPFTGEHVEIEGLLSGYYRRYSPENWEIGMGDSLEIVYDCEELESAYQAFKAKCNTDPFLLECNRFDAEMEIESALEERGEP